MNTRFASLPAAFVVLSTSLLAIGCGSDDESDGSKVEEVDSPEYRGSLCTSDADCPGDQTCLEVGFIGKQCGTVVEDCGQCPSNCTYSSINDVEQISCSQSCSSDADCPSGTECLFDQCEAKRCTFDADCGAGQICDSTCQALDPAAALSACTLNFSIDIGCNDEDVMEVQSCELARSETDCPTFGSSSSGLGEENCETITYERVEYVEGGSCGQ